MFKLSQKAVASLYVVKNGHMVNWSAKQNQCLGTEEPPRIPSPNSQLNEPSDPPGIDKQNVEESDGIPVPPGFKLTQPVLQPGESSKSLKAKVQKSQHEGLGKR